jgi:putative ABC transport system permease protein
MFAEGGPFTAEDVRGGSRVAVVGATVAAKAFGQESGLGRLITIKGTPFRVAGTLKPKGTALDGRDQDDIVFVPITTGDTRFEQSTQIGSVQGIVVKAASRDVLEQATENIRDFLRRRFRLSEAAPDCFTINNLASITQVSKDTADALSGLLGAIASISLLVGGIGIMNIMLVNVTERIREIGIRKAVGATARQILMQFLLEAVLITSVGSMSGLMLGVGAGLVAELCLKITVVFEPTLVVLSLGVATIVGVASGLYPAYKAARMQPMEALRTVGG